MDNKQMSRKQMNRYLRDQGGQTFIVRDGQSRDEINDRLRREARGERVPIEEPVERRPATSEEITAALRRLAGKG